ncbi:MULTISPECIES: MmgE/PrpD family protein [unclassified Mycobacterium]|uniref:MmgE/PrpD family protein n=1 Tax=unclassified Mycobacterium TaxID=2642494 RepID=UPI0029C98370|nr:MULTISPECIES: MmgE/PrpD family protein [unclassified Mycobacterium]
MTGEGATRRLARFVTDLRYGDLPEEVKTKARELVLHAWGVQLATSTLPWSKAVYRTIRAEGGAPVSTVVNYGLRTSPAHATFVNATFGHAFELDDNHGSSAVKMGCVNVAAGLAVGEQRLSSGTDLITAVVAGYEVVLRAGLAFRAFRESHEPHPTGTLGGLAAATVTAKLIGLDETRTAHALGFGVSNRAGYHEAPATGRGHVKRVFPGMSGAAGVRAAFLAEAGLTGTGRTLDAGMGFCKAFEVDDAGIETLTAGFGEKWHICDVHYKVYAQDGYIQPMTEAIEHLRARHEFDVDDIERVTVGTHARAVNHVIGLIREPKDLTDAQFSGNFSVAQALVTGGAGVRDYTEANLTDPRIRALSERVFLEIDDEIEAEFHRTRPRGAKVRIRLNDGTELYEFVPNLRALSPDDLDAKFRSLATLALEDDAVERLVEAVHGLEDVRDVSNLGRLLVGGARIG